MRLSCSIWIAKYSARVTPFRNFRWSPKRESLFTKIRPKKFPSTHWCMTSLWILMVPSLKLGTLKLLYGLLGIYWIVSIGLDLDYILCSSRRAVRRLTVIVQKSYRENIWNIGIDCAIHHVFCCLLLTALYDRELTLISTVKI